MEFGAYNPFHNEMRNADAEEIISDAEVDAIAEYDYGIDWDAFDADNIDFIADIAASIEGEIY